MKDLFLPKGLLNEDKKNSLQGYSIKKLFKNFLKFLHVPYVDDCCEGEHTNLPTAYNEDEEQLTYYNPDTKEWEEVIISGGGGSGARFGFPGEDELSSENRDFSVGTGMSFGIHSENTGSGVFIPNGIILIRGCREDHSTSIGVFDMYSYSPFPPITPATTGFPDGYKHTVFASYLDGFANRSASHGLDFRSDGQLYYYNNINSNQKSPNSVGYKLIFPVGNSGSTETIARLNDINKRTINEISGDYTISPSDFATPVIIKQNSGSPNTVTIDDGALSTVEIGTSVKFIQLGPGNTTFVESGGTTLFVLNNGRSITGRNGSVIITKIEASSFHICGDIIP